MYLQTIQEDVKRAIKEDFGTGDVTAELLSDSLIVSAQIISREAMVVCGTEWVEAVFSEFSRDVNIKWLVKDGMWLDKPQQLCVINGPVKAILSAERTALNFLQTLSGTASLTRCYVKRMNSVKTKLLDTRKTLPGLRFAQKYAVKCGGGENHRFGLFDAFLIKENHIKACGSITNAVSIARNKYPELFLEVEVETLTELKEALALHVDRILLDNFDLETLQKALDLRGDLPVKLEYSGNVSLDNISTIAGIGVDYISVGALTKSVQAIDLSLLITD